MDYRQAADLLRQQDRILLLTHRRPDGDTVGSAAALCLGLRRLGKTAYILANEEAHGLLLPYLEGLIAPEDYAFTFVVTMDTAALDLFPDNAAALRTRVDLAIDHHSSNSGYAKESCVDTSCAACGELVYDILKELGEITPEMAKLLYVAIATDTGCFVFSNTTAETHRIVAELMGIGCDHQWVNKRHFRTKSLARLQLEAQLTRDMLLLDDGRTVLAAITLEMIHQLQATEDDLDNISSYLEHVSGVENAVTLRELCPGEYKISLRTGGKLNASNVCALFGGGGHPAAAGCSILGSLDEAKRAIVAAIAQVQRESA